MPRSVPIDRAVWCRIVSEPPGTRVLYRSNRTARGMRARYRTAALPVTRRSCPPENRWGRNSGRSYGQGTMRDLPVPDPGTPDHRSAARYLWWIVWSQKRTVGAGIVMGVVWMVSQALMPAAIGTAIDAGVTRKNAGAL